MKVKFIGAELKEGDYQGTHYKNYMLYYVSPVKKDSEIFGVCPEFIKVKSKFIEDNSINVKNLNQKVAEVYWDKYGNLAMIDVAE